MTETVWRIELLGWLRASRGPLVHMKFATQKISSLLAYLALHPGATFAREEMAELFWPDAPGTSGRQSLRVALHAIRRALEPEGVAPGSVLATDRESIRLVSDAFTTDVAEFERAAVDASDDADALRNAAALYRGELLPGCYEPWALAERRRYADMHEGLLERLLEALDDAGDASEAIDVAHRLIALDPLGEEAHRSLMRMYADGGRIQAALDQYRALAEALHDELGVEPSAETRDLANALRRQPSSAPDSPARAGTVAAARAPVMRAAPAPRPQPVARHVAASLTRFVGREAELERLRAHVLERGSPLVTVVGPGGIGKTRLVSELARRIEGELAGRPWFVELSGVTGLDDVADLVAAAMPPHAGTGDDALGRVVAALGDGPGLLVLDNCEHVTEAAVDFVVALFERSTNARVVATSRTALGLAGEVEVRLAPLPIPSDWTTPKELLESPSVALYVDRVVARRPDFALTGRNAAAVARLCAKLEGIPLALELAAGRESVLPAAQLVARLEHRFEVLSSTQRDVPERHRTLSAAIDWSYEALDEAARDVFARLSVFRGGFSLEEAEAVCGRHPTIEAVSRMYDVSLVEAYEAGEGRRFRMLDTIREFAEARLEPDERESAERLHADVFLALAEQARVALAGPDQKNWLARLDPEIENVRVALDRLFAAGERERAVRIVVALRRYWVARSRSREPRRWLRGALVDSGALPPRLRARALLSAGEMEARDGDDPVAEPMLEQAVALFEAEADDKSAATALRYLGMIAARSGDYELARERWSRGLAIAERDGDPSVLAVAANTMGILSGLLGDYGAALAHYSQAVDLFREVGDEWNLMLGLNNIGYVAILGGELDRAAAVLAETLATTRDRGFRGVELDALVFLSLLEWRRGDSGATISYAADAVRLGLTLGLERRIVWAVEVAGFACAVRGSDELALELLGAANALRADRKTSATLDDPALRERHLADLTARVGPSEAECCLERGAEADLELLLDAAVQGQG